MNNHSHPWFGNGGIGRYLRLVDDDVGSVSGVWDLLDDGLRGGIGGGDVGIAVEGGVWEGWGRRYCKSRCLGNWGSANGVEGLYDDNIDIISDNLAKGGGGDRR